MDTEDRVLNGFFQKPKHITSLATSCVLVSVESHVWNATVQDKQISDEVTTAKKASADSGKFVKNLLAKNPEHKAVLNYRQTIYNWVQRCTYDWAGSQRLLPIANLARFHKEFREHEIKFDELVSNFLDKYPAIVSNMAFVQGDMFDRNEYPDVSELQHRFSVDLIQSEVPTGDFRCAIAQDLLDVEALQPSGKADGRGHTREADRAVGRDNEVSVVLLRGRDNYRRQRRDQGAS